MPGTIKSNNKCYICSTRGRGLCPSSGKNICSSCCGQKRGSDIICSPDCAYSPFSIKGYDSWLKVDGNLASKILRYIDQTHGESYFRKTISHMSFKSGVPEHEEAAAAGAAVYYILFVERDKDSKTLADKWKAGNWQGLNNDERVMINYRLNSRATIIEIQKILDNQAMECVDLLDPGKGTFILVDRSIAGHAIRFTRLLTWLTHYPNFSRPENNGVEILDFIEAEFMDILKKSFKKESKKHPSFTMKDYLSENFGSFCELSFDLAHNKQISVLSRMDLHQCKAFYKIKTSPQEIKTILDSYPDFESREPSPEEKPIEGAYYYSWLRRGESKELENKMTHAFRHDDETSGVGTIGNVTLDLYQGNFMIEVFSKQKFEFAKKMVGKYFGDKLILKNELVVDLAKQIAGKKIDGSEDEPADEEFIKEYRKDSKTVPIEIERKLVQGFYEKRYKKFVDEEIPALDNFTPHQAANDPKMRPRLVDLMKQHLKGIEKENRDRKLDLNIDWVLDELGLTELK